MRKKTNDWSLWQRLVSVLRWFYRNNSIGALSTACQTQPTLSRLFWLLLFLIGAGLTFFGVSKSIQSYYYESRYTTSTTYQYKSQMMLPAMNICNNNRIHCKNLYQVINATEKVSAQISLASFCPHPHTISSLILFH